MSAPSLSPQQERSVVAEVNRYLEMVSREFEVELPNIEVRFDLIGKTIGMYCKKRGHRSIRFNPYVFAKYWRENLADTVPHEVAHYVSDVLFDSRYIKPHGREWQSIMRFFGVEPKPRCYFDLSDIPKRELKRFDYSCLCGTHQLTAIRHNRIKAGKRRYFCRSCAAELVMVA